MNFNSGSWHSPLAQALELRERNRPLEPFQQEALPGHKLLSPGMFPLAYMQNWIKALRGDKKLAVIAAAQAQKAADYILNRKHGEE